MIYKSAEYKNGYIFVPSSTDDDFQRILKSYKKVNCVICNRTTLKNFTANSVHLITINNKLADGVFFINGTY